MDRHVDPALARDIDARCRLTGEFTLRSGQVAGEYFDKYLFETDPDLLARVAAAMVPLLPGDTDLLGGLEMGGIPIATVRQRPDAAAGAVRAQAGQDLRHLQARRGTADVDGRRVTLIEDVITTGGAVRDATTRAARGRGRSSRPWSARSTARPATTTRSPTSGSRSGPVLTKADLDAVRG